MNENATALASLSLAMIIVGSSVVFGKVITNAFPVFLASGLRFAIATTAMLPILLRSTKQFAGLTGKEIILICLMAFAGQFVFTSLLLLGLRYTSGIEAGIITSSSPAVMAVVAYLLFRETPGWRQAVGILMVLAGVICVNGFLNPGRGEIDSFHIHGNLIVVGAVIGEAFFLLMRKKISSNISDIELTAYLCFLGFLMFLPFAVYQGMQFDFTGVSTGAWLSMVYFGAVFTVLAYFFWFNGVAKVTGSTAGIFTAVMPVSSVILSIVFLQEVVTLHHAVGGILIVAAIILIAAGS
jgi:drug/metabolite transporter (DMT)-like permease